MDTFQDFSDRLPDLPFQVNQVLSGPHENFHYLVADPETGSAAVIDPAFHLPELFDLAAAWGYPVKTALFTHGHWDHIGGMPEIFDMGVERAIIHEAARGHPKVQEAGSRMQFVQDGDVVQLGNLPIACLHTPGHQPESTCYLVGRARGAQVLFGGDTLFVGSCGRTDFPGGNANDMFRSLGRLRELAAPDVFLLPGHHYHDRPWRSLDEEVQENPVFQTDPDAFGRLDFLTG